MWIHHRKLVKVKLISLVIFAVEGTGDLLGCYGVEVEQLDDIRGVVGLPPSDITHLITSFMPSCKMTRFRKLF